MIDLRHKILEFKKPAKTSRGEYLYRKVWYITIYNPLDFSCYGRGEAAPLYDLSAEYTDDYEDILRDFCVKLEKPINSLFFAKQKTKDFSAFLLKESPELIDYPSILFAFETALYSCFVEWESEFSKGEKALDINGLIWMSDYDTMFESLRLKINEGYKCIKLKIGAIDFEKELDLIRYIRSKYSKEELEIRLDANGAFGKEEALDKLKQLSVFDIHSIEQPIRQGQWNALSEIILKSPIDIALDEELIGCNKTKDKIKLLDSLMPSYIVLKPSLHGGLYGTKEWIGLAEQRNIRWWITSALESNVGLTALAKWTASLNPKMPQGLGTGMLFKNNTEQYCYIKNAKLWYRPIIKDIYPWQKLSLNLRLDDISRGDNACDKSSQSTVVDKSSQNSIVNKSSQSAVVNISYENLSIYKGQIDSDLYQFLEQWWNDEACIKVQTSGSTGRAKQISIHKTKMILSAERTMSYLNCLDGQGKNVLLCMSLKYIGAKMMVIRSMVSNMRIIVRKASSRPLQNVNEKIDFTAIVPLQLQESLQSDRQKLEDIDCILVGGANVDSSIIKNVYKLKNRIFSTYGMTETISHIALRGLSESVYADYYRCLNGVAISQNDDKRLIIGTELKAEDYRDEMLITNDLCDIVEDGFLIKGRYDNVINTGGVKICPEEVEQIANQYFKVDTILTSCSDVSLGEKLILLIEDSQVDDVQKMLEIDIPDDFKNLIIAKLSKYHVPKVIYRVKKIPRLDSSKLDRLAVHNFSAD